MPLCPCGSKQEYTLCCGRFHNAKSDAPTAEALMRARYSAFVKQEIDYLKETLSPSFQQDFDPDGYRERSNESLWLGLEILAIKEGGESDRQGEVTFIARSMVQGNLHEQKERSLFKKKNGRWYYVKAL